ncbi:MAG TPA: hypothetical protein VFU02_24100 [Polyangiaceae bacterium]|nr:hypothetical protein [Polyangiaceae bacterium]
MPPPDGSSAGVAQPFKKWFGAVLVAMMLATGGCDSRGAESQGPEEVVREFFTRMAQVHGNPADAKLAYELMWSKARQNLGERAKRASAAAGRQVAPEEMIAPSRFSMAFVPQTYQLGRRQHDLAEVIVSAEQPSSRSEKVWCRLEDGQWRVVVRLPPASPISKRIETSPKTQPELSED